MTYNIYKVYLRLLYQNKNNIRYLYKLERFLNLRKKMLILLITIKSNNMLIFIKTGASRLFSNWYQKKFPFVIFYIIMKLLKCDKASGFFKLF